ncbi:FecR family protein [Niabella hibiscisoli]|uniref:FecR family protein n=1 Tax=Niabella hibiscisoli TaxID=1825928 RepID=UPI001F0D203C|nr:FecR domain-containing protein [Niabella hibiscisoli]MCH5719791.1 FecR domain-containing protein [Niabella hibiscisoli]
MAHSIVPGTEKALLKLDDGTVIELDSTGAGNVASEGGSEIVKLKDGTIAYNNVSANQEVKFNEVSIPAGGSYKLRLPDGTMVWLNAVSSIRFPTRFTGPERKVVVKGEAYFEVAHNKKQPFIVDIPGRQQISVLGTHFNVNAYEDEAAVKTTLIQGSVKVHTLSSGKNVVLKPGQQTVVRAGRGIETLTGIDVEKVMAWKNGYFDFDQTEISEIMRQVSRWYNANIELDPRLKGLTFSGRLPRKENVQKLLKMFEATSTVRYHVAGNQIKVYQKNRCVFFRACQGLQFLNAYFIMRLTTFLLLFSCIQVFAGTSYSQYVTISCKNERIQLVLQKIEKQTGYSFFIMTS